MSKLELKKMKILKFAYDDIVFAEDLEQNIMFSNLQET